jgi:hypothetical protein
MAEEQGAGGGPRPVPVPGGGVRKRAIDRSEFEQVIRRAAELTISDADADEQLSEDEVLRIATELGLPAHHVRRALFELPEIPVQPRWYDRYYGQPVLSAARVVPGPAGSTLRRIEEYLVTREYLQVVRRRGEHISFVPADDTISSLARAFFRPGGRHHIARASRVLLSAHALPDSATHVRLDLDLAEDRSRSVKGAASAGIAGGLLVGTGTAIAAMTLAPAMVEPVAGALAFAGGMAATVALTFNTAARRFRQRALAAKLELAALLDRVEHGERLEPPPAPWRRRLQQRIFGPPPEER